MRLVDADTLTKRLVEFCNKNCPYTAKARNVMCGGCFMGLALEVVEDAPTIEPEQRWISCSELPDTDRNVFVARGKNDNMSVCIGHYDHDYKQWYEDRNWFAKCLYDGLYWCEIPSLPEPYREEGEK